MQRLRQRPQADPLGRRLPLTGVVALDGSATLFFSPALPSRVVADTDPESRGGRVSGPDAAPSGAWEPDGPVGAHPRLVAAALAVVSVAVVVLVAGGRVPNESVPRWEPLVVAAPHLNAAVIALATVTVVAGVRAVRRGNVARHRRLMTTSFGLFSVFLAVYCYRVTLEGPAAFPGPDAVYRFVYLPVLGVHVLTAIASLGPVYYALVLALTRPVERLPATPHPRVGRVAAALWLVAFVLGIAVYALLYVVPW